MPDWDAWGDPLASEFGVIGEPRKSAQKRVKHWQTKHITDAMVVAAVARYKAAMTALPPGRGPFGMSPKHNSEPFPYEALAAATGAPEKVTYAACERACARGLIEYGVSLRTGWLTDKGKALLALSETEKMVGDAGFEPATPAV